MSRESEILAMKAAAAERAVQEVRSGMILGLGTGSTAALVVDRIGRELASGRLTEIVGIPTSEATAAQSRSLGIPLASLEEHPTLDLAIDGADEVDPDLNLIKGLGGALLREKLVELASQRFVVTIDETKLVERLGVESPVPVEVATKSWKLEAKWLQTLGCTTDLRGGEAPFVTDNGNHILDCRFSDGIDDPPGLARTLDERDGVLAHGLFIGMATMIVVAGSAGVRVIER